MKKLKIYSTLLVVFLLGAVVTSVFSFHTDHEDVADDDKLEFVPMPTDFYTQDSIEGGVVTHYKTTINLPLYVRAYTRTHPMVQSTWHDAVLGCQQTTCVMDMQKLQLKMPVSSEEHHPLMILGVVAMVPQFILIVWIVVLAIKLTRRIRKGEVFVADVSKGMERTGWLLVVYQLLGFLIGYLAYLYASRTFHIAYYHVVYHDESGSWTMILGLVLLIISQVILMGKDLKEEQDLTI